MKWQFQIISISVQCHEQDRASDIISMRMIAAHLKLGVHKSQPCSFVIRDSWRIWRQWRFSPFRNHWTSINIVLNQLISCFKTLSTLKIVQILHFKTGIHSALAENTIGTLMLLFGNCSFSQTTVRMRMLVWRRHESILGYIFSHKIFCNIFRGGDNFKRN